MRTGSLGLLLLDAAHSIEDLRLGLGGGGARIE